MVSGCTRSVVLPFVLITNTRSVLLQGFQHKKRVTGRWTKPRPPVASEMGGAHPGICEEGRGSPSRRAPGTAVIRRRLQSGDSDGAGKRLVSFRSLEHRLQTPHRLNHPSIELRIVE